ncbi:putative RNA recognition motif domain-containing protein [Lupinus albus]|uniref:Putative RNA recognition motif domain-containing protein n=1 Tax=Lupinus albus TaxID=3870 RepID=A0A6A4PY84_LUPAL|nr:putative RNA recognition motif domain-containing protein [Lupinus albus]
MRSGHQFMFLRSFSSKIFVKGLAFSTTEQNLAEAFSQFGRVLNANIVLNKAKTRSKGFGYVTFGTEKEAREAQIGMDRKILHGRLLYVDMQPPHK